MPTALFLSPHLDDAAFSAGGTIAALARDGWRVVVATVFTRSVPDPAGFALACQTDKGLPADADYMALRRAEDREAMRRLGVAAGDVLHLDLPEAPHRGYDSAAALFAGVRADDPVDAEIERLIAPLLAAADRLYLPLGLGNHADHLAVIAAADRLGHGEAWRWFDTPYVLRDQGPPPTAVVDVAATLPAKLDACAAYTTQLGFQFGGEPAMRRELADLAGRSGGELFARR